MNVARKVSPENGSLHSNSFSASWCAKLERTKMLFLFSEVGDSLFILLFSIFFSFGNLQHYLSLDNVTNVTEFPKETLEGSPLQSTQNNLTCFSHRKSMGCFDWHCLFSLVITSTFWGAQKNPNKQSHNHTKNKEFPSIIKYFFMQIALKFLNGGPTIRLNQSFLYFRNLVLYC